MLIGAQPWSLWCRPRSALRDEQTSFLWGKNEQTQWGLEWAGLGVGGAWSGQAPAIPPALVQHQFSQNLYGGAQLTAPTREGSQQALPALRFP